MFLAKHFGQSTLRVRFLIPERSAELVIVALEEQLLSKVSVLIFQFRGRLLQFAQLVYDLINLVSGLFYPCLAEAA